MRQDKMNQNKCVRDICRDREMTENVYVRN